MFDMEGKGFQILLRSILAALKIEPEMVMGMLKGIESMVINGTVNVNNRIKSVEDKQDLIIMKLNLILDHMQLRPQSELIEEIKQSGVFENDDNNTSE